MASDAVYPWLQIYPAIAVDAVPLSVAGLALLIARLMGVQGFGLDPRHTRIDAMTMLLFVLAIAPALVKVQGVSRGPGGYSFITTSVAEEITCRGVWYAVTALLLKSVSRRIVSYPVLMSAVFFVAWHVPPVPGWAGLF